MQIRWTLCRKLTNLYQYEGPILPMEFDEHCITKIRENLVILIGGFLQSAYDFSDKTLMYDFSENFDAIRNGPTLLHKRDLHACGTFEYNGKTIEKKSLEGETGISTQWESGIRTLIVLYESPDSAFPLCT